MRTVRVLSFVFITLILTGAACRASGESVTTPNGSVLELPQGVEPIEFELIDVRISTETDTYAVDTELAETPAQRQRGLMYRSSMPDKAGMLFVFSSDQRGGFWMYNTFIPLSIAYIASDGRIIHIVDMEPYGGRSQADCSREAAAYVPPGAYRYALEVNQSYFDERDVGVGDSVSFDR